MKKLSFLILFVVLLTVASLAQPVLAQNSSEDYWQLVQTIEEPGDSTFHASIHGEHCSTHTVNWSNGLVSDSVYWQKTTSPDYYSYCENNRSMSFSGSASWTPPPKVIHAGDVLNLNGQATIHDKDTKWPAGVSWAVGYDTTHVCSVNPNEGTKYCENQIFTAKNGQTGAQFSIGVTVTVTGGKISPDGARMNSIGRYTYVYEWVEGETAAVTAPTSQDPPPGQSVPPSPPQIDPPSVRVDPPTSSSASWWLPVILLGSLGGLAVLATALVVAIAVIIKVFGKRQNNEVFEVSSEEKIDEPTQVDPSEDTNEWHSMGSDRINEWIKEKVAEELIRMTEKGIFIGNKSEFRKVWNLTAGQVTNRVRGWSRNSYCEEMVELGANHLEKILPEGSYITNIKIEKDDFYNHIANKIILPNGTELVVDYWKSLVDGKPAIYTVDEWMQLWEKNLGTPKNGKWRTRDVIDHAQQDLVNFIMRSGEENIDNWRYKKQDEDFSEFNIIRNWWRALDEKTKQKRKSEFFASHTEGEKESLSNIMKLGRIRRQGN